MLNKITIAKIDTAMEKYRILTEFYQGKLANKTGFIPYY